MSAKIKMKTRRSAAKRFTKTSSGKIRRHHAYASHLLEHKSSKQKRRLRKGAIMTRASERIVARLIPYA